MPRQRFCVFGAGAVGSHIAAKLLRAGQDEISVVARGPHLDALRERGLTFRGDEESFHVAVPRATDDPSVLPPQDVVLVTLKAPALPAAAAAITRLLAPDGVAVFLVNGIPWWWNHGLAEAGGALPLLDPDGALWNGLGPERVLGGVIYSPNELAGPGVVVHHARNRFVLGEPDGRSSLRIRGIAERLSAAGLPAEVSPDIRAEIWRKLLLNSPGNPLAALTRLSARERSADPELAALGQRIVDEVLEVARALGWDLREETERNNTAVLPDALAGGRPSMLQDVLLGRPTEVEGLLGQLQAFGRDAGVTTPVIDVVLPILRGLDRSVRQPDRSIAG